MNSATYAQAGKNQRRYSTLSTLSIKVKSTVATANKVRLVSLHPLNSVPECKFICLFKQQSTMYKYWCVMEMCMQMRKAAPPPSPLPALITWYTHESKTLDFVLEF